MWPHKRLIEEDEDFFVYKLEGMFDVVHHFDCCVNLLLAVLGK